MCLISLVVDAVAVVGAVIVVGLRQFPSPYSPVLHILLRWFYAVVIVDAVSDAGGETFYLR